MPLRALQPNGQLIAMLFPDASAPLRARLEADLVARAKMLEMDEMTSLNDLCKLFVNHGIQLGVATNDAQEVAQYQLEHIGAATYFSVILGADSGYGGKPSPGMLNAFLDHTGLAPSNVLMVGDGMTDVLAGKAAQITTIGVGEVLRHTPNGPDAWIADISHLPQWINTHCATSIKHTPII